MSLDLVLKDFGFDKTSISVNKFGSGLINATWMVKSENNNYILQRINDNVFKEPDAISKNIECIGKYLTAVFPNYKFTLPVKTIHGNALFYNKEEGYFRMFEFVDGSHTIDVVETPQQAFEAAAQFGKFTKLLSDFNVDQLKTTIPDFHNISLRYDQFLQALQNGNTVRIEESSSLIATLKNHQNIVKTYEEIIHNAEFKRRVTHHDTKISNVLFDENGKGLCVIDLDTVMPGYFISDVGDMMRTYLSPAGEDEKDFSKIEIRNDFYKAVVEGYYGEMKDELTGLEKKHFYYAGAFIIYMQALRFLADHINDDIYYGVKYPGHNLVRAGNQTVLLQRLLEKKELLQKIL